MGNSFTSALETNPETTIDNVLKTIIDVTSGTDSIFEKRPTGEDGRPKLQLPPPATNTPLPPPYTPPSDPTPNPYNPSDNYWNEPREPNGPVKPYEDDYGLSNPTHTTPPGFFGDDAYVKFPDQYGGDWYDSFNDQRGQNIAPPGGPVVPNDDNVVAPPGGPVVPNEPNDDRRHSSTMPVPGGGSSDGPTDPPTNPPTDPPTNPPTSSPTDPPISPPISAPIDKPGVVGVGANGVFKSVFIQPLKATKVRQKQLTHTDFESPYSSNQDRQAIAEIQFDMATHDKRNARYQPICKRTIDDPRYTDDTLTNMTENPRRRRKTIRKVTDARYILSDTMQNEAVRSRFIDQYRL